MVDIVENTVIQHGRNSGYWPLAHIPEAAGQARGIARAMLADWRLGDDAVEAIILVVSELVTNAIEHAMAPILLHLHHESPRGGVRVEVFDGGPAARDGEWSASCGAGECGRGLSLVAALSEAHGSRPTERGRAWWARLATEVA
ncbi:ATP-binding protein [Streptomyces sp. NPDC058525]|uniref:ATP-binding protein n=1 Tax=Streptomyces sp. NPDC058525 TaxID=3346538 RepID=UPI00365A4F9D